MLGKIVILGFMLLELSNVLALYYVPGSKRANAVGVFTAWEQSKLYPEIHDFVKYLVYWVAGAKLGFLLLLGVIILYGSDEIQRLSLAALCILTVSFFWRLFPLIRRMDSNGQINPKNYSIYLGIMILAILLMFALAVII